MTHTAPYVHFPANNAAEAFTHYGRVFGTEPVIVRATDMPGTEGMDPQMVMHAAINVDGIALYGSDDCMGTQTPMQGFEVCIFTDDEEKGRAWYAALAEGGTEHVPMTRQEWGAIYGQATDHFGLTWAVNIDSGATN